MLVYQEILQWSQSIPKWQRDALRRLVQGGGLKEGDLDELTQLCLSEYGLTIDGKSAPAPQPLKAEHVPEIAAEDKVTQLVSIHSVENVNLLSSSASLPFAEKGLTIVYGDNGSGKSGYARILKKVCRARAAGGPISPNIFEEAPTGPQKATVQYSLDGSAAADFAWTPGAGAPADLSRVCIFDSDCADFYVNKDNDVAYRPFGIDLFDKLAQAATDVNQRLQQMLDRSCSVCPMPPSLTRSHPCLAKYYPPSADINLEEVRRLAVLTDDEKKELKELKRLVEEENPTVEASGLTARKKLLDNFLDRVQTIDRALCKKKQELYQQRLTELGQASEAARLASEEAFSDLLSGTGADPWKQLWEYARQYSQTGAYPGKPFPYTDDDAKCVLCQQTLDKQAKERLKSFEKYVINKSSQHVEKCQRAVDADVKELEGLEIHTAADDSIFEELRGHDAELESSVQSFQNDAAAVREGITTALRSGKWQDVPLMVAFDNKKLESISRGLGDKASKLLSSLDSEAMQKHKSRLLELEAKTWLSSNMDELEKEVCRLKRVEAIKQAMRDANTRPISVKASAMSRTHITDKLRDAVIEEIEVISSNPLQITIVPKSVKGVIYHHVDIDGKQIDGALIKDIVSEGEFRAIALAAFLAELGQSSDRSAIVIDDPVSSLDHRHRGKVAERLVKESAIRQVVVLTHDLVFIDELATAASRCDVPVSFHHVKRLRGEAGVVCDGLPWQGMTYKQRIHALRERIPELKALYEAEEFDEYRTKTEDWYGSLRTTWERTVEECVLNNVVKRFSRAVETKKLRVVAGCLTATDYDVIDEGMAKCSRWLKGHDEPPESNAAMPKSSDLQSDIDHIGDFVKSYTKRRDGN